MKLTGGCDRTELAMPVLGVHAVEIGAYAARMTAERALGASKQPVFRFALVAERARSSRHCFLDGFLFDDLLDCHCSFLRCCVDHELALLPLALLFAWRGRVLIAICVRQLIGQPTNAQCRHRMLQLSHMTLSADLDEPIEAGHLAHAREASMPQTAQGSYGVSISEL